jgi:hypothetical protein
VAAVVGSQDASSTKQHKFEEDSQMSFERVFKFVYGGVFIPTMLGMAEELGREKLVEMLKDVASRQWAKQIAEDTKNLKKRDLDVFVSSSRDPDYFWSHVLSKSIVEDTKNAFEMKITECLWAKIFREANAGDIGYAGVCYPDYAAATVFNPKIKMIRTKTLMQGDGFCNHRYVYDET